MNTLDDIRVLGTDEFSYLRRIYTLAAIKGNVTIHNLGLAEPPDYYYSQKERYIRRNSPPGIAEFYVVGTVMLSSLLGGAPDKNRQLCIRPMWEQLGRGTAFIGALLKKSAFYVSTFRDGVSFSSMFPPKGALYLLVSNCYGADHP